MLILSNHRRPIATFLLLIFLSEIFSPLTALALTSGPSQPEVQSFEPVGTTDMVDMFTGDFNYNIPLMDVDGYPINIAYHGGISMDQEASWVGLGWNINPGVINRNMRGLPDDFKGDEILQENNIMDNITWGYKSERGIRFFAKNKAKTDRQGSSAGISHSLGFTHNNYRGIGLEFGMNPSFRVGKEGSPFSFNAGYNLNLSTKDGMDVQPHAGFQVQQQNQSKTHQYGIGLSASASYNSRVGLQSISGGVNLSVTGKPKLYSTSIDGVTTVRSDPNGGSISSGINPVGYNQTFGTQSWTPKMSMTNTSSSFNISFKYAYEFQYINLFTGGSGFYSKVNYKDPVQTVPAYGYLYEQDKPDKKVLLDFNREKDGQFMESSNHLPLTNHTFDIYSVSGHGTGGTFRPYRGDFGVVHDNYVETTPGSDQKTKGIKVKDIGRLAQGGLGIEVGVGVDISTQIGVNLSAVFQKSYTGLWEKDNAAVNSYAFQNNNQTDNSRAGYEPSYFKMMGEFTPLDTNFYSTVDWTNLVAPKVGKTNAEDRLLKSDGSSISPMENLNEGKTYRTKRDKRNTNIRYLTANEAEKFALQKYIEDYHTVYTSNHSSNTLISRPYKIVRSDNSFRKGHHISEVTITNDDGSNYVYGIPAYNNFQVEKTFNVGQKTLNTSEIQNNLVSFDTINDDSRSNTKGIDNYYNSIITPSHAHSYLLTSILSPDYVDTRNDGITDDDLGSAVKINYSLVHKDYKWRLPFKRSYANYSEANKSNPKDDKGTYIYGSKEIWHMQSIVGKNHIAIFEISFRKDGYGVKDENGGLDSQMVLYKLDKITLFAKKDWEQHGWNAYAIKTVHFQYDYSLCPDVENNSGGVVPNANNPEINDNLSKGKLTLKKIWFTYGKSNKGRLTPYVFQYNGYNPSYCASGTDRWGNYAPNNHAGTGLGVNDDPTNSEFPFTIQRKDSSDKFTSAWSMTDIILPSGGKITINYESDDYSHVMDLPAMCMYKIEGFGQENDYSKRSNMLYNRSGKNQSHCYVFVKLLKPISTSLSSDQQKAKFKELFQGQSLLQFNVLARIRNYKGTDYYEYVRSYADLESSDDNFGVCNSGNSGYFKIKPIKAKNRLGKDMDNVNINQITQDIWNYARINTPYLVHPLSDKLMREDNQKFKKFTSLFPFFMKAASNVAGGINFFLYTSGFGQTVSLKKSWVRLNAPDQIKYGGGCRVKSLMMTDNWNAMAEGKTSSQTYGQVYEYKDETGNTSGIAAYEPTIGNDENPFHTPDIITQKIKWIPDLNVMTDEPYGEHFFPSPVVGYSRVKVSNYTPPGVVQNATGYTINEYYTAKDFPVKVKFTDLVKEQQKPKFFTYFKERKTTMTAAQGYTVELNDMHGKPKKQLIFGQNSKNNIPISGTEYVYSTVNEDGIEKLSNKVKMIKPNGDVYSGEIGVDIDFVMDSRESYQFTRSHNFNIDFELGGTYVSPIPFLLPLLFFNKEENMFQSLACTKIVNRKGVLKKTLAFHNGATIETETLLYDDQTGGPIVTSIQNEFNDKHYSFTYPAHWSYDKGMGQAYKNTGLVLCNIDLSDVNMKISSSTTIPQTYLVPGDECILVSTTTNQSVRAWVFKGEDDLFNLIDANGEPITGGETELFTLKVIRSGRRNMHSAPVGLVTCLKNPITSTSVQFDSIISTSAVEYSDDWKVFCNNINVLNTTCDTINQDFYHGLNLALNATRTSGSFTCLGDIVEDNTTNGEYLFNNFSLKRLYDSSDAMRKYFDDTCRSRWLDDVNQGKFNDSTTSTISNIIEVKTILDREHSEEYEELCIETDSLIRPSLGNEFEITFKIPDDLCGCDGTHSGLNFKLFSDQVIAFDNIVGFKDPRPYTGINNIDGSPGPEYQFEITAIMDNDEEITLYGYNTCIQFLVNCIDNCQIVDNNEMLNPYLAGIRGNWRKKRDWTFIGTRIYNTTATRQRRAGTFKSSEYTGFWQVPNTSTPANTEMGSYYVAPKTNPKWVWANETTIYSPYGPELESRDALNRYSAAIYGFNQSVPLAVANNAKYKQIGYEGFEDFTFEPLCSSPHWSFLENLSNNARLDNKVKHSGKYSLRVFENDSQSVIRDIVAMEDTINPIMGDHSYYKTINACIGKFNPDSGYYLVGGWVKDSVSAFDTTFSQPSIKVILKDGSTIIKTYVFKGKGKVIEGWQRVEGKFKIPDGVNVVEVRIIASSDHCSWFDDLRIHPFSSNMKSYAYDPVSLRVMAEMDENNYASFYEYDLEGNLMRVKKETEKGISTLKESRSSIKK